MRARLTQILGRLNLTLLGLAIVGATFWFTDQLTNRQPAAPRLDSKHLAELRHAHPSDVRVFFYIIDSLRYETALDPEIMPNLVALRREGTSARMMPGFNSGTAASLRDAFTGRENAAVLAPVATFVHTDAGVESIFHQMALRGLTTAAYSSGFFHQFGAGIRREIEIGHDAAFDVQDAHVLAAVDALATGEFNCVFGHEVYTDAVAHEEEVGTPRYRATFRRADALIPIIRARLPANSTLIISGDHGHDLKGRHGIGLNVPTLGLYVGPRFRRGVDLGTTTIMSHRYLLSQALNIPITTDAYAGELLPNALEANSLSPTGGVAAPSLSRAGGGSWFIWAYLSCFAVLWLNYVCTGSTPLNFAGWRASVLWLGVVPFFLHGTTQWVAAAVVTAMMLTAVAWKVPLPSVTTWVVMPVLLALGFQGWGRAIVVLQPWWERLSPISISLYWATMLAAGCVLATRRHRSVVMAVIFAVPAFFWHPVYHRYGFPGTLAPLMTLWFVFYVVSLARDGVLAAADWAKLAGAFVGLFLMLQPLAWTGTQSGVFDRWHALIPGWEVTNWKYVIVPAVLAKLLLYYPRRPGWTALVVGVALIALVQLMECRVWTPDFYDRRRFAVLMLVLWLGAAWSRRAEARLFGLTFLHILYFSFVALTPRNFTETTLMIGALTVCAQIVRWFPQRENVIADHVMLGLFGIMITGWASMRWSGTHLEWHAIYEWASAATVEAYVAWFVPWIAVKGLVPWAIIVWMLHSRLGALVTLPARWLMICFCVKVASLLMVATGLGGTDTYNHNYLETASVVGVFVMLYLGLIALPRLWIAPAAVARVPPVPAASLVSSPARA